VSANYWYTVIQGAHFPNELKILSNDSVELLRSSYINYLNPFINEYEI